MVFLKETCFQWVRQKPDQRSIRWGLEIRIEFRWTRKMGISTGEMLVRMQARTTPQEKDLGDTTN